MEIFSIFGGDRMVKIVDINQISISTGKRTRKYEYESEDVNVYVQKFFAQVKKELANFKGQEPAVEMTTDEIKELAVISRIDIDSWEEYENSYKNSKYPAIEYALGTAKKCIARYISKNNNISVSEAKKNIIIDKKNNRLFILVKNLKI